MAREKTKSEDEDIGEFTEKYLKANGWITAEGRWYHPKLSKAMSLKEAESLQLRNDLHSLTYILERALERPALKKMLAQLFFSFVVAELAEMGKDPDFRKSVLDEIKNNPEIKKIFSDMEETSKQQIKNIVKEVLTEDVS